MQKSKLQTIERAEDASADRSSNVQANVQQLQASRNNRQASLNTAQPPLGGATAAMTVLSRGEERSINNSAQAAAVTHVVRRRRERLIGYDD